MGEKTCKVFTPSEIVKYILDKIGYVEHLYGKRILENSCGTGQFLCEIVKRYIIDGRNSEMSDEDIKKGLERDVKGIEKDETIYKQCIENLNKIALEFGITEVCWNIEIGDALKRECIPEYQFVVGNPPYITYYNLLSEDRELIRNKYTVCKKGKADYYYAFTEAAIRSLDEDGIMGYLIPNNFMKNRYSDAMRKYILPYLIELEDFKFKKLFENRLTSSAIIVCAKNADSKSFLYSDYEAEKKKKIDKNTLHGKWTLNLCYDDSEEYIRFKDYFQVSAPVATLLNEAFVIKDFREYDEYIEKDGYKLERKGLRKAVSPKSLQYAEKNYIIFPYYYKDGKCCRYTEEEFKSQFPQIAAYLKRFQQNLSKRRVDKKSKWFEYGRSQALEHINQRKLMLSTLITGEVKVYSLDVETVPYSGMYIVPKENGTIEQAEMILRSEEFYNYIREIGIHANGKTYRISPHDVGDYILKRKW